METNAMNEPPSGLDCPECGEPLRQVRETPGPGAESRAVFRCANAHTVEVRIIAEYDDEPAAG